MASSLNRVILCGNLGSDPEITTLPSGIMLAKFSLATTERYKDKTTDEWKENTDWHRIVCWDSWAKAASYLKKGSKVLIEGSIKYGQYTGNDNVVRYTTDIRVSSLVYLDRKEDREGGGNAPTNRSYSPPPAQPASAGSMIADQLAGALTPDMDDDIPF
jgi:single-strand DNA-binding protein